MVMYLVESNVDDETHLVGKDNKFISAEEPQRFVSTFAMEHGYLSFYEADCAARKLHGDRNNVVTVRI